MCRSLLLGVSLLAFSPLLHADLLPFEGFSDGTVLANQYPGVVFSNAIILSAGISLNEFEFPPHAGTNVASDDGGPLSIDFSSPIQSFSGYFTYAEPLTLQAFGTGNNLLVSVTSAFANNEALSGLPGSSQNELLQLFSSIGISRVTITGDLAGGSFTLDDASFAAQVNTVPEPATFVLLLTALVAVALMTRLRCVKWPRKRSSGCELVVLFSVLLFGPVCARGQQLSAPGTAPAATTVNTPTPVTITSRVSASNVIAGSVNVQLLDSQGRPQSVIGTLRDDGQPPDLVAGDRFYSGMVMLRADSVGTSNIQVSAALTGTLRRIVSTSTTIYVLPSTFPTDIAPSDYSTVVNDPISGLRLSSNEVVACFTANTTTQTISADAQLVNGAVVGRLSLGNCYELRLPSGSTAAEVYAAASTLVHLSEVLAAVPNFVLHRVPSKHTLLTALLAATIIAPTTCSTSVTLMSLPKAPTSRLRSWTPVYIPFMPPPPQETLTYA